MCDLVTDSHTHRTIVNRIVITYSEEWRLQDCGREDDTVHTEVTESVDCLRCHEPLLAIHFLIEAAHHAIVFKECRPNRVSKIVIVLNRESLVALPFTGIAEFAVHFPQFLESFFLRVSIHPVEIFNTFFVCFKQVFHYREYSFFCFRSEICLDIELAKYFTDAAVHCSKHPTPRGLHHFYPRKGRPIKSKVLSLELRREIACCSADEMPGEIRLPILNWFSREQRVHRFQELRLHHDNVAHLFSGINDTEVRLPLNIFPKLP